MKRSEPLQSCPQLLPEPPAASLCFASAPQLRTPALGALARHFAGAVGGGGDGQCCLQKDGVAVFCRLTVHCTDQEQEALKGVDSFGWVVPYHTPAHPLGGGSGEGPADRRSMVVRDDGPSEAIYQNDEER